MLHRNALSPERLVETFPAPDDDVRTLYDNLENALAKYPNVSDRFAQSLLVLFPCTSYFCF